MISDEQLAEIAVDLETDRVERKSSVSDRDRVAQAICAYANDLPGHGQPGYVLVGVTDKGAPSGLGITDKLLLDLSAIRDNGRILPLPAMVVQKRLLAGVEIAVIEVVPTADPPVRYEGRTWIRVGPRRAIASRDEERILSERRRAADAPEDARGLVGASLDDLDLEYFRNSYLPSAVAPEIIEENGRTIGEQLSSLHLLDATGLPTKTAVLLIGKAPRSWIPGAYLQFTRFDGAELDSPIIDQKEIDGRLDEILRRADELVNLNVRVPTAVEGQTVEQRTPDYPAAALQQLVRNAFMHRTYESRSPVYIYWFIDRVEIHSPGGLFGRVTPETFGERGVTDYRNPLLAQGLKILGFVQRFGMGIALARRRCTENGNGAPEFEFSVSGVACTVRARP